MENEIISNIHHLYRSHIVTLILYLVVGGLAVLVSVGVVKYKLLSPTNRILLLIFMIIGLIVLLAIQIKLIIPIYTDYKESSYVILENATMTLTTDASGTLDYTNQVFVTDETGNHYHLIIQQDRNLNRGQQYTGIIVYLKHSNYVIWYSFNQ